VKISFPALYMTSAMVCAGAVHGELMDFARHLEAIPDEEPIVNYDDMLLFLQTELRRFRAAKNPLVSNKHKYLI
jgi:hypothetical protein